MHVPLYFSAECWEPVEESAKGPKKSHRQRWAARRRNHKESQKVHTHTLWHTHTLSVSTCLWDRKCLITLADGGRLLLPLQCTVLVLVSSFIT